MAASPINQGLNPSPKEFGIWTSIYHEKVHQVRGIEERKLPARFKSMNVEISFKVSPDCVTMCLCDD
jgi:hypothetical protein